MVLKELEFTDHEILRQYLLPSANCRLSAYAFENIYLWKSLYRITWGILQGCLCVFFEDAVGCFLYLPPLPLSGNTSSAAIEESFTIMRSRNNGRQGVSRIENIPESRRADYQPKYVLRPAINEYICLRDSLVRLGGNSFKSKRSSCNYFGRQYRYEYRSFEPAHTDSVLELHGLWAAQRRDNADNLYLGMLSDSGLCLRQAIEAVFLPGSGYRGSLLFSDGKPAGFTLGYVLNKETFCVLYEFTDLTVKGAAQFIFRRFCSELQGYAYINIMDDSGLENLRRVKLSYHPQETLKAYTAAEG